MNLSNIYNLLLAQLAQQLLAHDFSKLLTLTRGNCSTYCLILPNIAVWNNESNILKMIFWANAWVIQGHLQEFCVDIYKEGQYFSLFRHKGEQLKSCYTFYIGQYVENKGFFYWLGYKILIKDRSECYKHYFVLKK